MKRLSEPISVYAAAFVPRAGRELAKRVALARAQPASARRDTSNHGGTCPADTNGKKIDPLRIRKGPSRTQWLDTRTSSSVSHVAYDRVRPDGDIAPRLGIRADDGCRVDRHVIETPRSSLYGGERSVLIWSPRSTTLRSTSEDDI